MQNGILGEKMKRVLISRREKGSGYREYRHNPHGATMIMGNCVRPREGMTASTTDVA
jgi:hypothetical protein